MSYAIEEIEGIGATYGATLGKAGIVSTAALLRRCADPRGRQAVAKETGLGEQHLLKWANLADLMRIKGIGPQWSELLEAAGVDLVQHGTTSDAETIRDTAVAQPLIVGAGLLALEALYAGLPQTVATSAGAVAVIGAAVGKARVAPARLALAAQAGPANAVAAILLNRAAAAGVACAAMT